MIGSQQPAPPLRSLLPTTTPITPPHPLPPIAQQEGQPPPAQLVPAMPIAKHPPSQLMQDEPARKPARMKSFPLAQLQQPQGPAVAFTPGQPAQSASSAAQHAQPVSDVAQPQAPSGAARCAQQYPLVVEYAQDQQKPRIVETDSDWNAIDWNYPLHQQLKPRLHGHPPKNMAELDLRAKRRHSPKWSEDYFIAVFPGQSRFIDVKNAEAGTHVKVDVEVVAAYILTLPQRFNTLKHSIMLCMWLEDWKSAAPFQYFPDFVEWYNPGFLPNWRIFCKDRKDLPNIAIMWQEPSTMWKSWPLIGFLSTTDVMENGAQHPPAEVGWRNFPPMWSTCKALSGHYRNWTWARELFKTVLYQDHTLMCLLQCFAVE